MSDLAAQIRATGRLAGLWLAPLVATRSSRLFREHGEWFLKDDRGRFVSAGFNWGQYLHTLDTTHPAVLEWLTALMSKVRAWGFDYLKIDFLSAGALPGRRYENIPRETAYRQGLQVIRAASGQDAYILASIAPILPTIGLCDALRIGPDVAGHWESQREAVLLFNHTTPGLRNAIRTSVHRLWLDHLVHLDPDVAYFGSRENDLTAGQKQVQQDLALICNFKATSELPQWLTPIERDSLKIFLDSRPEIHQVGRYTFELDGRLVDFSEAVALPAPARGIRALQAVLLAWLANQPLVLRVFDWMGRYSQKKIRKELMGR
jgi:alpha-galactosidase